MDAWSFNAILLAFGGGMFGASLGALWSFCLCGLLTMLGCLVVLGGGSDFLLLQVGLGPIFGPHTGGFVAGVVASTYAAGFKKNHPSGAAKDILSPLVDTSWDVLVVGGVSAVFGLVIVPLLGKIPLIKEFDLLALSICINIWLARLLFQKEMPWGNMESIREHGWLGTNGYAISWVGWMSPPSRLLAIGAGVGLLSGGVAMGFRTYLEPLAAQGVVSDTAAFVAPLIFCWGFSAIMLTMLNFGQNTIQKSPVTHCMAIMGAWGYLQTGSLVMAMIFGIGGAFIEELTARMFYNHGSNHLDPPAAGIALSTFIMNILFKPEFLNLAKFFNG